jgi:response regulator RpfG family c-di-GMP phosphodiesterase
MLRRILCVDDDARILQGLERQFRKTFEIQTALGPELGLQAIAQDGPFAVVVSDLRMPGMNGIEFLTRVRQTTPDTVRVMLTGEADLSAAISAVNEGRIFQFLSKPCPPEMLTRTLESALEQYRLVTAERELLESTLRSSIGVMSEILSLVNPPAFGRASRIRRYVQHITEHLNLPDRWQYEVAAMLSQIGCVTVPPDVLDKSYNGQVLNAEEQEILSSQASLGHDMVAKIPRLEVVAKMVANQSQRWIAASTDPAVIGAHLLRIASDFDEQVARGEQTETAIARMRRSRAYNPEYVAALQQVQIAAAQHEQRKLHLDQLRTGMVVSADVQTKTGLLLLAKGQEVTFSVIARLRSFSRTVGVAEPICVSVPSATNSVAPTTVPAGRTFVS